MVTSAPLWTVFLLPALLTGFATVAVSADGLLAARRAGRADVLAATAAPLREAARLLMAQRTTTVAPDSLLWRLGLLTVPVAGVMAALVIPFGGVTVGPMDVGVVWFNSMEVLTWAGLWMAGWGANASLTMVGGYRFIAQALAYELPLMFALITAATAAQSLDVATIVSAQQHLWFAVWMPAALLLHLAGVYAFSFLGPFAYPAATDIAAGVLAETSGVDRLLVEAGRWLLLTAGAAMAVALFLGGGAGPLLPPFVWSSVKLLAVLGGLVWVRRRVPMLRADRYLELAWVVLIPLAALQALVVAVVVLVVGGTP